MSFDAATLVNAATDGLRAYDPGHDLPTLRQRFGAAIAELGSNENPLGPSPRALIAAQAALVEAHRYPDPKGNALKVALSRRLNVGRDCIALGNGSHELLMLLAQCFADAAHEVIYSQYGFAVFMLAAAASGARATAIPAQPLGHPGMPLGHDLDAVARAIGKSTRLVYLANPNNPTGSWFDDDALALFLERVPSRVLVVVDEAYHEYVDAPGLSGALQFATRHPNLVVTRTFSKAYGLAGLRVGCAVAHPSVIAVLERLRESFNVNGVALAAAEAALGDRDHLARVREFNCSERAWLAAELTRRGYRIFPSQTNFLLLHLAGNATTLERRLLERGVIVRPMGGYGLAHTVRISIGSRAEHLRLLEALP